MPNPDYPIALLSQALVALWFETLATEPSGALALLEPRIAEKGPRCATDGEILWVDAWAVQEWLREPTNKKGRNALAAAGLELLYFWRQENGPWLIPGTSSDTVMTGVELPTWGDWVLEVQQSGNAGEQGIPDSSWRAGIWWKKQSENLWTGTLPDDHLVQLPDYWQVPLAPDALNLTQAKSTWRECMRDLRRHMGPGNPQVEKQWVDECLEHHPQELDAWMELDPPVPVSKNALFNLKDPKWVKEFLRRGAQTDTTLVGRSLLHHAVQTSPHMLKSLWEAGTDPLIPVRELLIMTIIGDHKSEKDVLEASKAAHFLMQKLEEAGDPFKWENHSDLLAPILPRCLLRDERRIDILVSIWPEGLCLQDLVPTLEFFNYDNRSQTWPLPLALGALAAEGLTKGTLSLDLLVRRLLALQRLGVCFSESYPEGGVYHAAMLHTHDATVALDVQHAFAQVDADWNAKDRRGYCARTQKVWRKGVLRQRQHEQIPWDELDAIDLERKLEKSLGEVVNPQACRLGRL